MTKQEAKKKEKNHTAHTVVVSQQQKQTFC